MERNSYKLIITIVGKGKAERVIDVSHKAGAVGGTILFGHGAAVRLLLGISVEPEKDIVLTLIEEGKVQTVIDALVKEMELNEPHKGICFILSLDRVVGLYQDA
jgi:nitrogen regulatory protein PII